MFILRASGRQRERERKSMIGGGAERENPQQAPQCQQRAPCGTRSYEPWGHDLSRNQESDAWPAEPPRHPLLIYFEALKLDAFVFTSFWLIDPSVWKMFLLSVELQVYDLFSVLVRGSCHPLLCCFRWGASHYLSCCSASIYLGFCTGWLWCEQVWFSRCYPARSSLTLLSLLLFF